jgi:hypothetical protein
VTGSDGGGPDDEPEGTSAHLWAGGSPSGRSVWSRDLTEPTAPDLAEVAATDKLLDRLAARRPSATDLDDPAVAVLALLATDIDLHPAPVDRLRLALQATGHWPPAAEPGSRVPPTEAAVLGGPAWRTAAEDPLHPLRTTPTQRRPGSVRPDTRPGRSGPTPPRQVRLRLLTVAATAVVALYGVVGAVTGAWNPLQAGSIIAGTDDGTRIETELTAGLGTVLGKKTLTEREKVSARALLAKALVVAKSGRLTTDQREQIGALVHQLASALQVRGTDLGGLTLPDGRPVTSSPVPGVRPTADPSSVPTGGSVIDPAPALGGSATSAPADPAAGPSTDDVSITDPPQASGSPEPSGSTSSPDPKGNGSPTDKGKPSKTQTGKASGRS